MAALIGEERGIIAIMFALMLPLMLGFIGLGIEAALWYKSHRDLQSAADAAAIAAGYEIRSTSDAATRSAAALREAERHEFDTSDGDTFTLIYQYPTTGSFTTDENAVEIQLTQSVVLLFSNWFLDNAVTVNARSVATLTSTTEACVLALAPSASAAITNAGGATVSLTGCSMAVNSTSSSALKLTGASILTTECVSVSGGIDESGGSSITTTECPEPLENAIAVKDPYEDVTEPTSLGCDYDPSYNATNETLDPGTYCGGINFNGTVTLNSGVYIIDGGTFKINAGATVTNASGGVTIFLTKQFSGPQYADVDITGGATVTMEAQTTGSYAGLLFYQDDDTPLSPPSNNTIAGGTSIDLTGALYFPKGYVNYTGGATTGSGSCTQIIAQTITFSSVADMNINCSGSGMSSVTIYDSVTLVE